MKTVLDTHTHTLASAHAYSTIMENAAMAKEHGLALLCTTDHAPALSDSSPELHFMNYHVMPKTMYGVEMLYGVELNIMDFEGRVDLKEDILKRLDICIASFHTMCTKAGTIEENTRAYLKVMENPYVDIIGHPDDGYIPVDFKQLVLAAKKHHVLLEVNNASLASAYFRLNTRENMKKMLLLCKEHQVSITIASDAHIATAIGKFDCAAQLLEEVEFPEELIANLSVDRFKTLLAKRHAMRPST